MYASEISRQESGNIKKRKKEKKMNKIKEITAIAQRLERMLHTVKIDRNEMEQLFFEDLQCLIKLINEENNA